MTMQLWRNLDAIMTQLRFSKYQNKIMTQFWRNYDVNTMLVFKSPSIEVSKYPNKTQLWCNNVAMTLQLWCNYDAIMTQLWRNYDTITMQASKYPLIQVSKYEFVQESDSPSIKVSKYRSIKVSKYPCIPVSKYPCIQESNWTHYKTELLSD